MRIPSNHCPRTLGRYIPLDEVGDGGAHRVSEAVEAATSPGSERVACVRVGFPGTREASSSPS